MKKLICIVLCWILLLQTAPLCSAEEAEGLDAAEEAWTGLSCGTDAAEPVPEPDGQPSFGANASGKTADPPTGEEAGSAPTPGKNSEKAPADQGSGEDTLLKPEKPSPEEVPQLKPEGPAPGEEENAIPEAGESDGKFSFPDAVESENGWIPLPQPQDGGELPEEEIPVFFGLSPTESEEISIADTFPDSALCQYVLDTVDKDHSGGLSEEERLGVQELLLAGMHIGSLRGIDCFPQLQYLNCSGNALSVLNVSGFPRLHFLLCENNRLTSLNLGGLPELKMLSCRGNPLTALSLSGLSKLNTLDCSQCRLTFLELGSAADLTSFSCTGNSRTVSARTFPVSQLGSGFSVDRVTGVTGGSFDRGTGMFSFSEGSERASYTYDCGGGQTAEFSLRYEKKLSIQKSPARAPDCENPGVKEHYKDPDGKLYLLEDGKLVEVSREELSIPALGHLWGKTSYSWEPDGSSCRASRTCRRNAGHIETALGKITSRVTREPTEEQMGETTYETIFTEAWAKDPPVFRAEDIPRLPHDLIHVEAVEPACETAGNIEYWRCSRCGRFFRDAMGQEVLQDTVLPALGHQWQVNYSWEDKTCRAVRVCSRDPGHREEAEAAGIKIAEKQAKCLIPGETTYQAVFREDWAKPQTLVLPDIPALGHSWGETQYHWAADGKTCQAERICARDPCHREQAEGEITPRVTRKPAEGKWGETTYEAVFPEDWADSPPDLVLEDIQPLPHEHSIEKLPGTEPTCRENGKKSCYHCRTCGKYFEDKKAAREIQNYETWGILPGGHVMAYYPGIEPNCTDEGKLEHWYCRRCSRSFADPGGAQELGDLRIPPLEHIWQTEYTWDGLFCTAVRTCSRDPNHRDQETAEAIPWTSLEAGCCSWGETTYTAVFKALWADPQSFSQTDLPPLGHSWGETIYRWSPDGKTCTAERVCLADGSHRERILGKVSGTVTQKSQPGQPGKTTYRAEFKEDWAEPQTCVLRDIRALPRLPEETQSKVAAAVAMEPDSGQDGMVTEKAVITLEKGILTGVLVLGALGIFLILLWKRKKRREKSGQEKA